MPGDPDPNRSTPERPDTLQETFLDQILWSHEDHIARVRLPVSRQTRGSLHRPHHRDTASKPFPHTDQDWRPAGSPRSDTRCSPNVSLISLNNSNEWAIFDASIVAGMALKANRLPWQRILCVLRDLGAVVCVTEPDYICLDYRSELAAFYSQLNVETPRSSLRLHFFKNRVDITEVFRLSDDQRDSYLGYVVLRAGDLPLVGRTVIQVPEYVSIAATITETVNFFGQHLKVEGVPFMQQDERFDVCAHVTAWAAHYSAFRRGLVGRRLIADFVTAATEWRPMSPTVAMGFSDHELLGILPKFGLSASRWISEALEPGPKIGALPDRQRHQCQTIAEKLQFEAPSGDPLDQVRLGDFIRGLADASDKALGAFAGGPEDYDEVKKRDVLTSKLKDLLIVAKARPYLTSRWPIYCQTLNHAMLLCGLGHIDEEQPVFFFHDDQYGPYLASRSAISASEADFAYQSRGSDQDGNKLTSRPDFADLAPVVIDGFPTRSPAVDASPGDAGPDDTGQHDTSPSDTVQHDAGLGDADRGVIEMIIPLPPRLFLDPSDAVAASLDIVSPLGLGANERRVFILMGTDYRQARRAEMIAASAGADVVAFFSSMALAEWVILVEGTTVRDGQRQVEWEFVFDGSSDSRAPVIQFARYGDAGAYWANGGGPTQVFSCPGLIMKSFDRVPSKIGKAQDDDDAFKDLISLAVTDQDAASGGHCDD